MLVKVKGTATKINRNDFRLDLNLPAVYFDSPNYTIALRSIFIRLLYNEDPLCQYFSLKTTMVDRCDVNPDQEIATFVSDYKGSGFRFVHYEPTQKQEYKIQRTSLADSEFILTTENESLNYDREILGISKIEILLEFSKYARI